MNKLQNKYLKNGFKRVKGWFSADAILLMSYLLQNQEDSHINGSVMEIGVHHGRSFILLSLFIKNDEKAVAIDLFENQSENIDNSGCGDKAIFISNLKQFNPNTNNICIVNKNSTTISSADLFDLTDQKFRFISIDGGHTSEIVYSDLNLANSVLADGGIILIDDYFDQNWPGVSEGTLRFLFQSNHDLIPLAIFDDKILLTNSESCKQEYLKSLLANTPEFIFKDSEFLGQSCLICYSSSNLITNKIRKSQLWQKIKNSKSGEFLRGIIN